jgi:hypothetical protein
VLRAAVWSGDGAWHATAPDVTWTIDGAAVTEAPAPPFTAQVHAENAKGDFEDGVLVVEADAEVPVVAGFTRTVDGADAAIALDVAGEAFFSRWMSTGGTFTETGPNAADWVADEDGVATLLALTLDRRGGSTWTWVDVATHTEAPLLAVGGRLLPTDGTATGSGWFLATLSPAPDTLAGFTLTDVVAAADGTGGDTVCGLDPFDPNALADGRCGMDEAGGARVTLQGEALP